MDTHVDRRTALQFVERHAIVLELAHGPVVTFAHAAAGERIRGNFWSHPKSHQVRSLEVVLARFRRGCYQSTSNRRAVYSSKPVGWWEPREGKERFLIGLP